MNHREREVLRTERVAQMCVALSQKIGMLKAIEHRYGQEGVEVIREAIRADIYQWVNTVVQTQRKAGIGNDINGLHAFWWEPNTDERIKYTFRDSERCREYAISHCPFADFAVSQGNERYARLFFCDVYPLITSQYNSALEVDIQRCKMNHDDMCIIRYTWQ